MKNKNALATKLSSTLSCILKKNDIKFKLSLKNIVTDIISFAFIISVFIAKNIVNTYKKNFAFNTKNI